MSHPESVSAIYANDKTLVDGVLDGKPHMASIGPYLSCLQSFGVDIRSLWKSIEQEPLSPETLKERLFDLQLGLVRERSQGKHVLGILIHEYSATMFNQMLPPWAEVLAGDGRFELFLIINAGHLCPPESFLDQGFAGIPRVWAPPEQLARFEVLDAVISLDFAAERMRALPKKALRILQPHGTDILARYSYMFYGAGLMFDYLLCPSFAPEILDPALDELLIDLFPTDCRDHDGNELVLIPFGNIKLDSFIARCAGAVPRDIIYNFSCYKLESDLARRNAIRTVERLLESFPEQRVVFRPFPGELDQHRELIERFTGNPRFFLSTVGSYIDDYRNGALLIHHRGSSAEIFSMATLQPSLRLEERDIPPQPRETGTGFELYSLQQLIEAVASILNDPALCRERLLRQRTEKYPHAGSSLTDFLDQLHGLLETGERPSGWRTLRLESGRFSGHEAARVAIAKALHQGDLIPMLGTSLADRFPNEALFQLYAAWSIWVHIYPSAQTPDPWLAGCEYLAAFFRQAGDAWEEIVAKAGASQWLIEELPVRLLGLMGRSANELDAGELARLRQALSGLPLDPFRPGSIPARLRDRLSQKMAPPRENPDLLWGLAREFQERGENRLALQFVAQSQSRSAADELLFCRILFGCGESLQALNRCFPLFAEHPAPEVSSLLFEILACFAPVAPFAGAAAEAALKLPEDADALAIAVNLARCWQDPELSSALRMRLDMSSVAEAPLWRELISGPM